MSTRGTGRYEKMMIADRYVRQGTAVPMIYPGTVKALSRAMADAVTLSRRVPGQHEISVVRGGARSVIQVYEDGECTWVQQREEQEM